MEKLQQILDDNIANLKRIWIPTLLVDENERELDKRILLEWLTNWLHNGFTMSLADLLFNTPFLSWLEWSSGHNNKRIMSISEQLYEAESHISDYHKINLVLLDTDEARIIYITNNTL